MSVFKRIGTQRHKYKMEFFIKKVTFSKTLKGSVYITIKRGTFLCIQVIIRQPQNRKCPFRTRSAISKIKS